MEEFGSYLKTHREKKGIRLEEIASITKIHLHNLELLESGRWDQLPPEPFLRGFITAYSKYVGLSPREAMDKYTQLVSPQVVPTQEAQPVSTKPSIPAPSSAPLATRATSPEASEVLSKFQLPSWPKIATAAGVFAVAGISLILIQVGKNADAPVETAQTQMETQVEMVPEGKPGEPVGTVDARNVAANPAPTAAAVPAATAPAVAAATVPAPAPVTPPAPGTPAHQIEIESAERTWVKVVVDAEPPVEFFLSPGKKAQYNAQQKVKVVLGNATGAKIVHNGVEAEGKRFMGTIRSFRFPANAQFPQDVPKPAAAAPDSADAAAADGEKKDEE